MFHQVIGDTAMILHFVFLALVTFGGFLTWKWPRLIWVHLPVAVYALGITVIGWDCPLTHIEEWHAPKPAPTTIPKPASTTPTPPGASYPKNPLPPPHPRLPPASTTSGTARPTCPTRGPP